ncbi:tRNA (adenosine(37)-N6)-threonylcarbamoyltransferase complex dimerization subunit type 1 TsaB [Tichowtungia aerotolerans]|uniref:tRNA (Adenosine(37)-N6)-threonylcarbamoyltransferase complex dimerization subunit type 1 TsaB n=1 Tax=Tichowtungia aerotolerans TaxID=2697043 RepID=A0A6P1M9Q9_9BACT|nr:tRNA (adenosine(37)-N6)-threonylcarbamoyltransferase complex dimerization subunit type 1 TsaB [Tichowtungia aerotolerans]QHI68818.1 tRNA (adenosine(37)-N6)-threonylcarbamoyltransferase complex dimerization subunit type 1 TsaB [Tichowtungia aerotolerans]
MITLGIECSSRQGSLALLRDGDVIGEKSWIADRVRHNTIFQTLETLIQEAELSYRDISRFAVGRGPGSFSGMRMSLAIAQALALPDKKEVRAVSSGAALALAIAREGAKEIAVVGDARRGQVWIGLFQALEDGGIKLSKDWELIPYEEVSVSAEAVIVSPEAERLTKIFPNIGCAHFPHAKEVADLAQTRPEDLEPLYMHPPVFIEPKFS